MSNPADSLLYLLNISNVKGAPRSPCTPYIWPLVRLRRLFPVLCQYWGEVPTGGGGLLMVSPLLTPLEIQPLLKGRQPVVTPLCSYMCIANYILLG